MDAQARRTSGRQSLTRLRRIVAVCVGLAILAVVVVVPRTHSASAASKARRRVTTKVRVPVDFGIKFVQDAQDVVAGGNATYTFDISTSSTFSGIVVFDLPNLTDRFTGRVVTESATRGRLEITVPPFANTNSGVFVLRGRGGSLERQAAFRLNVTARPVVTTTTVQPSVSTTAAPQFTLVPDVVSRSGAPGEQQQFGVAVNRLGGFTGPVEFRLDGLPAGATAGFSPSPTAQSTVLYVTPSPSTRSGTYLLSIVGQAGSTTRATAVILVVRRTGDFALGLAPLSVTVPAGNDAVAAVNVLPRAGSGSLFAPDVALTATGLPSGASVIFDPNPSNGLTTVRIRTLATTTVGTSKITITATSASFSRSIVLSLVVEKSTVGGFAISAEPLSATVAPGADATYNVVIAPGGGFSSTISFQVKGLPPFATATVVSQTATSATIKVATAITTPTGSFPLQISGTAGSLAATVQVALVVA
jgi:hypothetical protein